MKILQLKLAVIVILISCGNIIAQNRSFGPSPDAYGSANFENFPIDPRTGIVSTNVPIYELNDVDVTVPVAISYHNSGIKVDQMTSRVGLGWSLQGGGVVTRSVRGGIPDDHYHWESHPLQGSMILNYRGWLHSSNDKSDSLYNFPDGFSSDTSETQRIYTATGFFDMGKHEHVNQFYDSEADLFTVSFLGRSAQFVFDPDSTIHFLKHNELDISFTKSAGGEFTGFNIVDETGTLFVFDQIEVTTMSINITEEDVDAESFITAENALDMTYNSSWYLSKIITPQAKQIDFIYKDQNVIYTLPVGQRRWACDSDGLCGHTETSFAVNQYDIDTKILKRIEGPLTTVHFTSITKRKDSWGGKALDKIMITNTIYGDTIKYFAFDYEQKAGDCDTTDKDCIRLFLNSITELDKDECQSKRPFQFTYNSRLLPIKGSTEQDFWGYYNDNGSTSLIPKIYVYPDTILSLKFRVYPLDVDTSVTTEYILRGVDRSVNDTVITAGMLQTIIYPTGGAASFYYESNEYYDADADTNILGGGIRIQEVRYTSQYNPTNDNNIIVKRYTYEDKDDSTKSSGLLIHKLAFARPTAQARYFEDQTTDSTMHYSCHQGGISEDSLYNLFTQRVSSSMSPLSDGDGVMVSYQYVRVDYSQADSSADTRGYSVYEYHLPRNYKDHNADVATTIDLCSFTKFCTNNNVDIFGPIDKTGDNIYPHPPLTDEGTFVDSLTGLTPFGKLISQTDYTEAGGKVKKVSYEYDTYLKDTLTRPHTIYGLNLKLQLMDYYSYCSYYPRAYSMIHTYTDAALYVSKVTEEIYNKTNNSDSIVTVRVNFYDHDRFFLSKTFSTNSDTTQAITKYFYPFNYELPIPNAGTKSAEFKALEFMTQENMVSTPIEAQSWIKKSGESEKMIGGRITTFLSDSILRYTDSAYYFVPLAQKVYAFRTATPDATADTSSIDYDGDFTLDSKYDVVRTFDLYDSTSANLLQSTGEDGIPVSTIYTHDQILPISIVRGGRVTDEYIGKSASFFGFEENNASGWDVRTDYWKVYPSAIGWEVVEDTVHTGLHAFRMTPGGTVDYYKREFKPEVQDGKFLLSAWVMTEDGFGNEKGEMIIHTKDDTDANDNIYPTTGCSPMPDSSITIKFGDTDDEWLYIQAVIDLGELRSCTGVSNDLRIKCIFKNRDATKNLYLDDIRFHRLGADMKSIGFDSEYKVTSTSGVNSKPTYYEFDAFGRKHLTKDHNGDILERTTYHIKDGASYFNAVFKDSTIADYKKQFDNVFHCTTSGAVYHWDYGDSNTATTTSPTIQHQYASSSAFYTVKLTVKTSGGTVLAGPYSKSVYVSTQ